MLKKIILLTLLSMPVGAAHAMGLDLSSMTGNQAAAAGFSELGVALCANDNAAIEDCFRRGIVNVWWEGTSMSVIEFARVIGCQRSYIAWLIERIRYYHA